MSISNIIPIPALKDNYIWAIINAEMQTLIVDPGEALPVINYLNENQLQLTAILLTHHHWDHINGVPELLNQYDVPVVGPKKDKISTVTMSVNSNDVTDFAGFPAFEVLEIPGHTHGHIAYYTPGSVFCGDTLFAAGCGRIFEGTVEEMYASLQKLVALPLATKVYCAHEYTYKNLQFAELVEPGNSEIKPRMQRVQELRNQQLPSVPSTMEEEKATNPFLRCQSPELIANVERYARKELNNEVEVFQYLRQWKNVF